jgi:hypothetical protein
MRIWITTLSVLVMFSLAAGTAEAKSKKAKDKAISGTIVSVASDGGSLVLQTKGKKGAAGEQKTITINASTTIEINNAPAKASGLHGGMTAMIKMTGGYAADITVGTAKHKKKK